MDAQGDNGQFTKRVTLPSGKTIEVVYFADDSRMVAMPPTARAVPSISRRRVTVSPSNAPAIPRPSV